MTKYIDISDEREQEFWANVRRTQDCWTWMGAHNSNGIGLFSVKGQKWSAHRIAWVIEHQLILPTWHKVQRSCRTKDCVRPSHLKRIRGTKPKRVNGHRFHDTYQLRARNGDGSDKPKKKIKYDDFHSYVRDLKDVLSGVTYLNSQFTQLNTGISQLLKYIGKIDPPTADVIAKAVEAAVGGRLGAVEQRMDALSSRLEEILDHVERPKTAPEPEPSAPEPSEPEPPPQVALETAPPVEPVNDALPGMLMQAFQAEMGAPQQPTGDDHEALGVAFDLARAGSDDTTGAVRLFAVWLTSFRKLTIANDTMERSPATFAAQVVAGSLT